MTSTPLEIRAYTAADNAVLSDIWYRASLAAHPFLGEDLLGEQRKLIEEVYLPEAETFVACIDGAPVGFLGLLGTFVGGLFVDPHRQGQGIGRALMAHGLQLRKELTLEVYALNTGACAFYRRLGFRETGRRPRDDNGLPLENLRMHRAAD
ncbi:GNAT family N-acetyltransferase [Stappia sp. ICDLI1TA098]|jgi:putative acetyltransferase